MTPGWAVVIAFVVFAVLLLSSVPVAFSLALSGTLGILLLTAAGSPARPSVRLPSTPARSMR